MKIALDGASGVNTIASYTPGLVEIQGRSFSASLIVLPDRLLVYSDDGEAVIARVHERGLQPVAVLVRRSTLEDVFLRLTGRTLVD